MKTKTAAKALVNYIFVKAEAKEIKGMKKLTGNKEFEVMGLSVFSVGSKVKSFKANDKILLPKSIVNNGQRYIKPFGEENAVEGELYLWVTEEEIIGVFE